MNLSGNLLFLLAVSAMLPSHIASQGTVLPSSPNFYKEAVNNILKYSNASNVSIALSNSNNKVTLTIEDDGIGFDDTLPSHGNGLNSMRARASAMKADIAINSRIGKGTKIHLRLAVK